MRRHWRTSVHAPEDVLEAAYELARDLRDNTAPVSAAVIRQLLNHASGQPTPYPAHEIDSRFIASLPTSKDAIEGVMLFLDSLEQQGASWISAAGAHGLGHDPTLEKILLRAENDSVDRVLEAVGLADSTGHRAELRALIRAYGQLARSAGRDWLLTGILTREQVRILMRHCLLTIVQDVLPATIGTDVTNE